MYFKNCNSRMVDQWWFWKWILGWAKGVCLKWWEQSGTGSRLAWRSADRFRTLVPTPILFFSSFIKFFFWVEKCKVIVLPSQARLFPNKVTCNLATWESITWDDYQVLDSNQHLIEEGVLSPSDAFFKANFTRLNSDGHFGTPNY